MTTVQRVAQILGWVFILIGVAGFFVTGMSMNPDTESAPRLLGLFPVNALHNLVHLLLGIWGVMAARSFTAAKNYAIISGIAYLGLTALAFVAPDTFGIMPIGSHDIWLHALLGIVLTAAGFTARAGTPTGTTATI